MCGNLCCDERIEAVISAVSPGSGMPADSSATKRKSSGRPTAVGDDASRHEQRMNVEKIRHRAAQCMAPV
jgi:hypothetical protein